MNLSKKLEAQEKIKQCVDRYFIIAKAESLRKRNVSAGMGTSNPQVLQVFLVAYLNLKKEIEEVIQEYITPNDLVGSLASAKFMEIYTKCLRGIRAYTITSNSTVANQLTYLKEYEQPKLLSEEIATLTLFSDEFFEDLDGTTQIIQEEVEQFG